jgi:hypothetical protein
MTVYGITDLAHIWIRNGGSPAHVVDAVSVSLAESGGNDHAQSPSSDFGLWQINSSNFGAYGLSVFSAFEPDTNARVAIAMSSNGTNWAPWCTCWTDPYHNCGHGFIAHPQAGSPAGNQVGIVAGVLGLVQIAGGIGAGVAAGDGGYVSAWGQVQDFLGAYSRRSFNTIHALNAAIQRIRT